MCIFVLFKTQAHMVPWIYTVKCVLSGGFDFFFPEKA